MDYRLINYHGSEFAITHKGILVFRSYSLDKIHKWFKTANIENYQIG